MIFGGIHLRNLKGLKIVDTDEYTYIEGIGTATEEGNLDLEGLLKTLLQERYLGYL